jgi:hypothetical protein
MATIWFYISYGIASAALTYLAYRLDKRERERQIENKIKKGDWE